MPPLVIYPLSYLPTYPSNIYPFILPSLCTYCRATYFPSTLTTPSYLSPRYLASYVSPLSYLPTYPSPNNPSLIYPSYICLPIYPSHIYPTPLISLYPQVGYAQLALLEDTLMGDTCLYPPSSHIYPTPLISLYPQVGYAQLALLEDTLMGDTCLYPPSDAGREGGRPTSGSTSYPHMVAPSPPRSMSDLQQQQQGNLACFSPTGKKNNGKRSKSARVRGSPRGGNVYPPGGILSPNGSLSARGVNDRDKDKGYYDSNNYDEDDNNNNRYNNIFNRLWCVYSHRI